MNRVEIKTKAKEIIKGRLWDFWKGYLIFGLVVGVVETLLGFIFTGNLAIVGTLIASLVTAPLSFGFIYYAMRYARGESLDINDIFKYKKAWIPTFLLTFLISLFTTLWMLLLIIPGIIAALSYSMAPYIYCDEEKDAMECIKASKEMMNGYKWDYFVFSLSFIGWGILGAFTFGLLYIWLTPYMMTAEVLYYDELKKIRK